MSPAERKRLEHALRLIARQHGGSPDTAQAAKAALARWCAQAPANAQTAQAAWAGWAATQCSALQGELPLPARRTTPTRRHALLGALGVAGLIGALGRWHWLLPLEQLALQTGQGQLLSRHLADGSRLDLAPGTRAAVALYRQRREVRLERGEIRLDVANDAARPFEVLTALGRVRVLGTVFSVALRPTGLEVQVARGRVGVWREATAAALPPDALLGAGQGLRLDADAGLARHSLNPADVGAWREGWLVFDRAPLAEVVARWNDYLARPLLLGDSVALQGLRLTGSFKLRDPATFLASLPRTLPVRVEPLADGRVAIHRR